MKKNYNIWNIADLDLIISDYLGIFDIENQGWSIDEIVQLKNTLAEVIVKYREHKGIPYVEYILESDFEQHASDYDDMRDIKKLGNIKGIVIYQRLDKEGQIKQLLIDNMETINALIELENLCKLLCVSKDYLYYLETLNDILLSGRVKTEFAAREEKQTEVSYDDIIKEKMSVEQVKQWIDDFGSIYILATCIEDSTQNLKSFKFRENQGYIFRSFRCVNAPLGKFDEYYVIRKVRK